MRHKLTLFAAVLFLVEVCGCAASPVATIQPTSRPVAPNVVEDEWEPEWPSSWEDAWGRDCEQRFGPGCVVVYCHGWYTVHGHWLVIPTNLNGQQEQRPWWAEDLIAFEQKNRPGRTIVLLCCNPDGCVLHGFPNVFYSTHDTFMDPDCNVDAVRVRVRALMNPGVTGNAGQLIEAK